MNVNQLNSDVLRAFGIDAQHVTEAYIQLRPGHPPTAIVESVLQPLEVTALGDIKCATQHYRMEPVSAPAPEPQPPALDIHGMCCMARNVIHIAVERAGDDAKHALMLRSARYNQAHGLPLSAAQQATIAAAARKKLAAVDDAVRADFLARQAPFRDHSSKWAARFFGWDEGREHV